MTNLNCHEKINDTPIQLSVHFCGVAITLLRLSIQIQDTFLKILGNDGLAIQQFEKTATGISYKLILSRLTILNGRLNYPYLEPDDPIS